LSRRRGNQRRNGQFAWGGGGGPKPGDAAVENYEKSGQDHQGLEICRNQGANRVGGKCDSAISVNIWAGPRIDGEALVERRRRQEVNAILL